MSLSPLKIEILETMLLNGKPMKAVQIAGENKKEFPPTMMHLIGLTRMGYVSSPEKGLYELTENGKKALGITATNKENAKAILAYAPHDKSFEFYLTVGSPLHIHAHSIQDFANKLTRVDIKSIEFHSSRGDFEAWFKCLGDQELAKKVAILEEKKLSGEELRTKLHDVVEQRCHELMEMTGQTAPSV
jgi:hypothetical protein